MLANKILFFPKKMFYIFYISYIFFFTFLHKYTRWWDKANTMIQEWNKQENYIVHNEIL